MNDANNKRTVTVIPADERKQTRVQPGQKLKVAAYCRVSTDDEDQLNSYRVQMDYYTKHIMSNDNLEFAGIYADEGISGTQVKKRAQFLKMIKDCEKGKIDMILTKSVSRFARNIVDSISYVRKLKAMGISIYFEEQHIDSLKEKSEAYIGIFSAIAQSESENISGNVRWGILKRMENGTYSSKMDMFGYRRDKVTKEVYIVPEEAEAVRMIYRYFLDGMSTHQIAKELEKNNIKTFNGGDKWHQSTIMNILQNEKYCGDVMYQKTYILDCMSKKQIVNHGKRNRYLVSNDHEPIVSRDLYYAVQAEFARRKTKRSTSDSAKTGIGRYSSKYAFSELLVCGDCGGHFRRKTVKKKNGTMHYWRCINRLDYADRFCSNSVGFEENALKDAVCRALFEIFKKRANGMELVKSHLVYVASADDTSDDLYFIDKAIKDEEQHIVELANFAIKSPNNRDNYEAAISDCTDRIKVLRERREEILRQLHFNQAVKAEIERIERYLTEDRAVVTKFDDCTVRRLINSISISKDMELTIYLKGGYEVKGKYSPIKNAA